MDRCETEPEHCLISRLFSPLVSSDEKGIAEAAIIGFIRVKIIFHPVFIQLTTRHLPLLDKLAWITPHTKPILRDIGPHPDLEDHNTRGWWFRPFPIQKQICKEPG